MQPIFSETERNGIFEANLSYVNEAGKNIQRRIQWRVEDFRKKELDNLLQVVSFNAAVVELDIMVANKKKEFIQALYNDFKEIMSKQ